MRHLPHATSVLLAAAALACADSFGPEKDLPALYSLSGEAFGSEPDGRTAQCSIELAMELTAETRRTAEFVEYAGQVGGHLGRLVLDAAGDGQGFMPEVFYPEMVARFGRGPGVAVILMDSAGVEGRFWKNLATLRADWLGDAGSGAWACAPLDIVEGGWVDTAVTVQGTWRLERQRAP